AHAAALPKVIPPTFTVVVTPSDPNAGAPPAHPGQAADPRPSDGTKWVHHHIEHSGHVDFDLPNVGGVVADVNPAQLADLSSDPDVVVTPDAAVSVADASMGGTGRAPAAVFPQTTGASRLWARGVTGSGVTVAVLDTGIDPLPDFGRRLIGGVDLSGEG